MSKILKNNTASAVPLTDTGVTVPASGQYTIPPQDYLLWAASSDVITEVGNAVLTVNDGSFDLNISDGIDLIKGLYDRDYIREYAVIEHTTDPTIGNRTSITLPSGTVAFRLRSRDKAKLQIYETAVSSTYWTLNKTNVWYEDKIRNGPPVIYLDANKSSTVVEVLYWTA